MGCLNIVHRLAVISASSVSFGIALQGKLSLDRAGARMPQGGAVWFLKGIEPEYRGEKSTVLRAGKESSCYLISMSAKHVHAYTHSHTQPDRYTQTTQKHTQRQTDTHKHNIETHRQTGKRTQHRNTHATAQDHWSLCSGLCSLCVYLKSILNSSEEEELGVQLLTRVQ